MTDGEFRAGGLHDTTERHEHMTDIDVSNDSDTTPDEQPTNERRALLRKLAVGGAGAAVGSMALSSRASAGDSGGSSPADSNAVELGDIANTSDTPTGIQYSGSVTDDDDDDDDGDATGYSALTVWSEGQNPADIGSNVFPGLVGAYGNDTVANGLHGSTTNGAGFGAVVASLADASGDDAAAPSALALASANGAHIKFVGLDGAVVGPTPGLHGPGEMYVDADGNLWYTVAIAGSDSEGDVRFVKLAGTATAGSLHTLPFPIRVFDTREGDDAVKPAASSLSEVDLTTKLDGSDSGLGAGSTAALLNVTIADSDDKGFFAVSATGVDTPDAEEFSNGNWTQAGTNLGTSVTTAISADGTIDIELGPEGGTHLIVDVVGFYL